MTYAPIRMQTSEYWAEQNRKQPPAAPAVCSRICPCRWFR